MSLQLLRMVVRPVVKSLAVTKRMLFDPKLLLFTNTGLCVALSITGDVLQQRYQASSRQTSRPWDGTRTTRVAGTGLLIGPFVHYWYLFLDRWLPGRTFRVLCQKVIVDQLVCSPIYLGIFMLSLCYMEGRSWPQVKKDLVDKGSELYLAEWVVWPPAQFINFFFLPTKYRVLYDNSVSLGFDCYWSYVWFERDREDPADLCMQPSQSQKIEA